MHWHFEVLQCTFTGHDSLRRYRCIAASRISHRTYFAAGRNGHMLIPCDEADDGPHGPFSTCLSQVVIHSKVDGLCPVISSRISDVSVRDFGRLFQKQAQ